MLDISTVILAGAGGLSIAFAFIDYRFQRRRKMETRKNP